MKRKNTFWSLALCASIIMLCASCGYIPQDLNASGNADTPVSKTEDAEQGVSFWDLLANATGTNPDLMDLVKTSGEFRYYREVITDTMYLATTVRQEGSTERGITAITPLIDPDTGLPMTYDRFSERFDALMGDAAADTAP